MPEIRAFSEGHNRKSSRFLSVAAPYNFAASVQDYGWISLAPNRWLPEAGLLERVERLSTGTVVLLRITAADPDRAACANGRVKVNIDVEAADPLSSVEENEVVASARWMLRLDEDFEPFYRRARGDERLWGEVKNGRGRLLRSPTLFEDVVKTICTTNTTWRQTKTTVQRLVDLLGSPYPLDPGRRAFPSPNQIAAAGVELLQDEVRLGYRSAYIHGLAERPDTLLPPGDLPPAESKKRLLAIRGVGEYAANNVLMLMGHYGELALDSEMRAFVKERYFNGRPVSDKEILSIYDQWGEWRYLAYWFDLIA